MLASFGGGALAALLLAAPLPLLKAAIGLDTAAMAVLAKDTSVIVRWFRKSVASGVALNPSLLSQATKGQHMIEVLNELDIAAACVGNHDLDVSTLQSPELQTCQHAQSENACA